MVKKLDKEKVREHYEPYGDFDRREQINGVLYELSPSPTVNHQKLVMTLWDTFHRTCEQRGIVLISPLDVHFDKDNYVQPDLIFIKNENSEIIKERIEGTPDLLCEILSPSSGIHDKVRKKELYERFGVGEYWIVDPVYFTVDSFILNKGKFSLQQTYGEEDSLKSVQFPCISIDLTDLFKDIR